MNKNVQELLRAVSNNDYKKAKQYAEDICSSTARADQQFCNSIKAKLRMTTLNLLEVPINIRGLLVVEDVKRSFKPGRYLLTERETEVFNNIQNMYKASQRLAEMDIFYLNSVILYGESGTGKTMFGRYIAWKLELPFAYINFSNAVDSLLGETGKNISRVFDYTENFPCVLMIDEIDAVGIKRGSGKEVGELSRIVISIMQALDKVRSDTLIIGATNRLDIIDDALLRRFSIKHEILTLSFEERISAVKMFLDDVGLGVSDGEIEAYCCKEVPAAELINGLIQRIAKSIVENTQLSLLQNDRLGGGERK